MASERSANCPGDNKPHNRPKKHKVGKCPPIGGHQDTKAWEDYWQRGHGSSRDICIHTQGPDASQGAGWQDTYRCYLGSKPSKELVKKYGNMPACYKNGQPAHIPKPALPPVAPIPGGGGKKPSSGASQCAALLPFGEAGSDGTPSILADIKYFQDQEMRILNQIQTEAVKTNPDENQISTMTNELKVFQDARIRLLNQLRNVSTQTQCSLASDRTALQDQLAMTMLAEDQLKTIEKETQKLINERNNKHRMIEITNYEYDRFSSHKDIFRTIAFCSLFVLAGIYIGASGNDTFSWLGYPIVVLAIAVAIFLTIKRIWWNYYRNERNWKQFDFAMPGMHRKGYETVWQHDKKAFEKLWDDTKYEADRAEDWADKEYTKGKKDLQRTYKDLKKDASNVGKSLQGDLDPSSKKGQNQLTNKSSRENFAPFN